MEKSKYLISMLALPFIIIIVFLAYKALVAGGGAENEDAASREGKRIEPSRNLSEHESVDASPTIPVLDKNDVELGHSNHPVDEQLKAKQEFHNNLIELAKCENIEKAISPEELKNQERDLLLSGASNGEILEYFNDLNQTYESCKKSNLDENRKTSHDLALELLLSGDIRGLYYLTSMVLPIDFETYSEAKKNEYRNYVGELLNEQVVQCEKMAINIYANSIGEGTHWSQKNINKSYDLVKYEKQLLLDFLKRKEGLDEPDNEELIELSSKLSPEELDLVRKNTETIFKNCFERDSK